MFKKLLSNLPFNPSLITQVSFYAKRLHKEAALRRAGLIMISLTMAVQLFAVISPAEASNQCSSNDVIRCGFTTRSQAVQRCTSNTYGFRSILEHYGVSCDTLANAGTQTIHSSSHGNQLYSMGRNPYQKPGEYGVSIPNAGTFYLRPLSSWGSTSYRMLVMQTPDGQPFMVMYDCGNIVIKGGYTPPAKAEPPSQLKLAKVNNPAGSVKPGDTIEYTLAFSNTGGTSAFFSVNDQLPNELEYISSDYGNWIFERNGQNLKWYNNTPPYYTFGNTDAFGTPGFIKVRARVKANTPSGTSVCNKGWLVDVKPSTGDIQTWSENVVCNTVIVDCPDGTIPNNGRCEPRTNPDAVCSYLKTTKQISRTKFAFETKSTTVDGAVITGYTYNFGDASKEVVQKSSKTTDTVEHEYKKEGTYKVRVTVTSSVGSKQALTCETQLTVKSEETPLISQQKKAKNITANKEDANGTVASAGDVIEYSLMTTNYGEGEAKDALLLPEELADILEYADLDFNSLDGAIFDEQTQTLAWNKPVTIKPGQTITKTFKVRVKNPLPQTPSPVGNPGSFNLVMTNVYGNTVEIKLPTTVTKSTEQVAQTLPNTGPGEALAVGALLITVVGYFFARSRLMAKELDIIKVEYSTGA